MYKIYCITRVINHSLAINLIKYIFSVRGRCVDCFLNWEDFLDEHEMLEFGRINGEHNF